jgi:hypothetical protein
LHKEIKNRLNSWKVSERPVQNLQFSRVLSNDITVKIQNIILPVFLSGRKNLSLILWEYHRQRIIERGGGPKDKI